MTTDVHRFTDPDRDVSASSSSGVESGGVNKFGESAGSKGNGGEKLPPWWLIQQNLGRKKESDSSESTGSANNTSNESYLGNLKGGGDS